jgi:hypothetical protein
MHMRVLLLLIVFTTTKAFAQSPALPLWKTKDTEFSCKEMKVKDENTGSVVFDGLKDSYIKLSDKTDHIINSLVTVKLGNYFELANAVVTKCEFKMTKDSKSITYTASTDTRLCVIIVSYGLEDNKPSFIIVSTNDNWGGGDAAKRLTFTLDGLK